MSEEHYLREISAKLFKSKGHEYTELTANSIYAHNSTLDKFKKLKINDHDELLTTDNTLSSEYIAEDGVLLPGSVFTSNPFENYKLSDPSFLVEADANINQLTFKLLVSNNDTNYYELNSHYVTEHVQGLSNQIYISNYHFRYYKVQISNTSGSNTITYSVSIVH